MTKHVFTNAQCAHVWAQQRAPDDWGRGSSVSFRGATFLSYATPIARFVWSATGATRVALFSADSYSPTTARHLHHARRATSAVSFDVPTIDRGGYGRELSHPTNLRFLVQRYEKSAERLMWLSADGCSPEAFEQHLNAERMAIREYATLFDLPQPRVWCDVPSAVKQARKLWAQPHRAEKAARAAAARAEYEARQIAKDAENRLRWIAGEPLQAHVVCEHGGAMLQVRGDKVVTSWGAEVPLDHAQRVFAFYQRVLRSGKPWPHDGASPVSEGHSAVTLGHFRLDSIDADGNVRAGCHVIYRSELERVGASLTA